MYQTKKIRRQDRHPTAASKRNGKKTAAGNKLQEAANGSMQVKQLHAYGAMANGTFRTDTAPVQMKPSDPVQFGKVKKNKDKNIENINKRSFNKGVKDGIGGTKPGHDISHKASANYIGILHKRIAKNPKKMKPDFPAKLRKITDQKAFTKKDKDKFELGLKYLENICKKKTITPKEEEAVSNTFRLFANRNLKNLRNKPEGENRSIGAYPHFNIEDGELTDDGEEILDTIRYQLDEYSESEFSDDEELRVTNGYKQLKDHLGIEIENTSDQVDYRKKENNLIE